MAAVRFPASGTGFLGAKAASRLLGAKLARWWIVSQFGFLKNSEQEETEKTERAFFLRFSLFPPVEIQNETLSVRECKTRRRNAIHFLYGRTIRVGVLKLKLGMRFPVTSPFFARSYFCPTWRPDSLICT